VEAGQADLHSVDSVDSVDARGCIGVEYDAQGHGVVDLSSIGSSPSGGGPLEIKGVPDTGVVCHNGVSLHGTKEPHVPTKSCTHGNIHTSIDQIGIGGVELSEWGIGPPGGGRCRGAGYRTPWGSGGLGVGYRAPWEMWETRRLWERCAGYRNP